MSERPNESLVEIEQFSLDQEWLNQPKLVMKYSQLLADAKKQMLQAKAALDLTEAELELEIRRHPENYDLPKLTESVIKAAVIVQAEYQEAVVRYNNIRHKVDVLSGVLEALQHRKKALEDLVTLHGQGYFAEPQAGEEDRKALEGRTKDRVRTKGVTRK